jgi:O-antigen/teichoic acid export membrane protein
MQQQRSRNLLSNIVQVGLYKVLNVLLGFAMIALIVDYLDTYKYGVWVTLTSISAWFSFFDIGLGNGLRNKFAEAKAKNNMQEARIYVSTAYAVIGTIVLLLLGLYYAVSFLLDWNFILNVNQDKIGGIELSRVALIVFLFFIIRFFSSLITSILLADQRASLVSFLDFFGKLLVYGLLWVMVYLKIESFAVFALIVSAVPILLLTISTVVFFQTSYKAVTPSLQLFDRAIAKTLLNLGTQFFIIQVAFFLLYQTNYFIITHLISPAEVTVYDVVFRLFTAFTMGFSIVMTPMWSAFTDAWHKEEYAWVNKTVKRLLQLWGLFILSSLGMLYFVDDIYGFWLKGKIQVPFLVSLLMAVVVMLNLWNTIFSTFLNGIGKLKLQLYFSIISALVNLPLAIYLGKMYGIEGVLMANLFIGFFGGVIYFIQYKKIVSHKANGIWNA